MQIVLAILLAFIISAFQYLFKRKALLLFALRFLSLFLIFLLILNPKIEKKNKNIEKPDLFVLVDQSKSIKKQGLDSLLQKQLENIQKDPGILNKFKMHILGFDKHLKTGNKIDFSGERTDIAQAVQELKELYQAEHRTPVILLSDGQITGGADYSYSISQTDRLQVFPVVLGDTIKYEDLKIDLLNVNPYAYKGNRFPVEIFVSYAGNQNIKSNLRILSGKQKVFQQRISLSNEKKSQRVRFFLKAAQKGNFHYKAILDPLENEKNRLNNTKNFSVQVIDNAKKILIVSNIIHPDLGAVKRSLGQQEFVQVSLKKPSDKTIRIEKYSSLILYQPTTDFKDIFRQIKSKKSSWLILTGTHTDWKFLNEQKLFFKKDFISGTGNFFPKKNGGFSLFSLPDIDLDKLPALKDVYGKIKLADNTQTAIYAKIKGVETKQPLLAFNAEQKQAVLLGENLWKWRMYEGVNHDGSGNFDALLQQSIQYLSLEKKFDRLQLNYTPQYFQGEKIVISAQILDKNLAQDTKAKAELYLKNGKTTNKYPLSLINNSYQVNLSSLSPGTYDFSVLAAHGKLKKSGAFVILPFSPEEKNQGADLTRLSLLAENSNGKIFFSDQLHELKSALLQKNKYPAISTIKIEKSPLIARQWLLFFILLLLAAEWFIKKLRGEL